MATDFRDWMAQGGLNKSVKDALDKSLSKHILEPQAKALKDKIVLRTRTGKGTSEPGGRSSTLKPLKSSYIDYRRKFVDLSSATRPSKSNATLTGDLMDKAVYEVSYAEIVIRPHSDDQYKADALEDQGRIVFNLNNTDVKQLEREFRNNFIRAFEDSF